MLTRAAALIAPRLTRPPPIVRDGVIVAGELTRASGLGESARLMLRALATLGVPSWPLDIAELLPAHDADFPAPASAAPPSAAALVLHVNAPMLPWVLARLPRDLARRRRIVGFWAWELPVLAPAWRAGVRFVHEAWAPSDFTADAISPLLKGRVRTVPHPLAAVPPAPATLDRAAFGLPAEAVMVLVAFNLASSLERKNPMAAVAAFRAAFGDRPDRLLLLKVGNAGHAPADFAQLAALVADAPNIRLETRTLPVADAHALTGLADIVLSLHRSEGFGLVPAEAMLLGRPVVATGWSGNMTFMDHSCAALVGYRLVPARDPRGVYSVAGARWAEPDVGQAAEWLRRLADDVGLRARMGAAGREVAQARLGNAPLAEAVRGLGLPVPA
jgi:glycosyltransferase involved in cell wall biosynthesis